jgi:DnaK suppressor protein
VKPDEIDQFRARLEAMLAGLREEGDLELETIAKAGGEGKVDDDAAPLSEMNQAIASSRNRERTVRVRGIRAALGRLAEDPEMFGTCEGCDDEIPRRRLELMPWVTLCIACQSKNEDGSRAGARKNLTDYS